MNAVIYARYSSDNQREESIEGQIRECTAYAEKNGMTVIRSYIDRAMSAKTDNRPEFQHMIRDSGKRLFDVVIVWKLDRFARNRYDSAHYKSILKKNGVRVISATEAISEGAEGIILESVLEGYAEYYSAELAEKVLRGMKENALKCKYNGGPIPLGYRVDEEKHFQVDPLTAPIVLEIFQRHDEGQTIKDIAKWLEEKDVRNRKGNLVGYHAIEGLLANRRYLGEYRFGDVVVPGGMPQIVPEELFESVQQKLKRNQAFSGSFATGEEYLLTTKLFCGRCGSFMHGESGRSHNGSIYRYYKCMSAKRGEGCKKKAVSKNWIEDLVVNETRELIMDDKTVDAIIQAVLWLQTEESSTLRLLQEELAETETSIENILDAIQKGVLTKSTKARLEKLEQAQEALQEKIDIEKAERPQVTEPKLRHWFARFRDYDYSELRYRKLLIDSFVNAVYLYDDRIVIGFNYRNGTREITLKDLKSSDIDTNGSPANRTPLAGVLFAVLILPAASQRPRRSFPRRRERPGGFSPASPCRGRRPGFCRPATARRARL